MRPLPLRADKKSRSSIYRSVPITPSNPNQDGTVITNAEPPSHDRPKTAFARIRKNPYGRQSDRYARSLYFSYDTGGQPGRHSRRRVTALLVTRRASGPAFCPDTNDVAAARAAVGHSPPGPCARERALPGQSYGRLHRPNQHPPTRACDRPTDSTATSPARRHRTRSGRVFPPYQHTDRRHPAVFCAPGQPRQSGNL